MSLRDELVELFKGVGRNYAILGKGLDDLLVDWLESKLRECEAATVERCLSVRPYYAAESEETSPGRFREITHNVGFNKSTEQWKQAIRSLSPNPDYIARREAQARLEEAEWWRKRDTVFEVDFVEKSQRIPSLRRALARLAQKPVPGESTIGHKKVDSCQ